MMDRRVMRVKLPEARQGAGEFPMTTQDAVIRRRVEFDVVLDAWPDGAQGKALHSLVASGDVAAVRLSHGFIGLTIVSAQMLLYLDAGQLKVRQVLPAAGGRVRRYQGTGNPVGPA
jgi:hypothetical protein